MKLNKILLFTILCLAASLLSADSVTQEWANTYNGVLNLPDILSDIAVDNSGNVFVTGISYLVSGIDIVTVKYNSAGVQQWARIFDGGYGNDIANAIAVDASGYIYVAGQSASATSGLSVCRLIKYDSAGNQMWTITYQGTNNTGSNYFKDVRTDGSGNIYAVGVCAGKTSGLDYVTIKYNSGSSEVWDMTYNSAGTTDDIAAAMTLDSSGNVYITGNKGTIKYNNAGVQQWIDANYPCLALTNDSSSNIYTLSTVSSIVYVFKYNSAGVKQWGSAYPPPSGSSSVTPTGIAVDSSGNCFFTGIIGSPVGILTAKFDSYGFFLWDNIYDLISAPSFPGSIACDQWGNAYTAAIVNRNIMTLKYDSDGYEKWNMIYAANLDNSQPVSIVVKSGEIYVGGSVYTSSTNLNYAAIKYGQHFCKYFRSGDLNGDCKVNFKDLAEMAANWAECNLYPASDCQ